MGNEKLIVACVQQRLRLPQSLEDYTDDARRFLRIAESKHARLVVFPELAGMSLTLPLLAGFRATLFKRIDAGRRRSATLSDRIAGALAERMTTWLKTDLRSSLKGLLDVEGERVWRTYSDIFGKLSKEFRVTLVAPSAYMPDPRDGVIRNIAGVFGPNGELNGHQAKVMKQADDADIAKPGSHWDVIGTEVGLLGVILGNDVLYPEVGRVLAYQGAEMLIAQAACQHPAMYNKLRSGVLARMQDNQLFCVASFAIGGHEFNRQNAEPYLGKSAILAPQELTPRYNGVLVEMGNQRSEGVVTAEWDFEALKELWEVTNMQLHLPMPGPQMTQMLASLYMQLQSQPEPPLLDVVEEIPEAEPVVEEEIPMPEQILTLADLPVMASITSPWPLPDAAPSAYQLNNATSPPNYPRGSDPARRSDDETDEMDAV